MTDMEMFSRFGMKVPSFYGKAGPPIPSHVGSSPGSEHRLQALSDFTQEGLCVDLAFRLQRRELI